MGRDFSRLRVVYTSETVFRPVLGRVWVDIFRGFNLLDFYDFQILRTFYVQSELLKHDDRQPQPKPKTAIGSLQQPRSRQPELEHNRNWLKPTTTGTGTTLPRGPWSTMVDHGKPWFLFLSPTAVRTVFPPQRSGGGRRSRPSSPSVPLPAPLSKPEQRTAASASRVARESDPTRLTPLLRQGWHTSTAWRVQPPTSAPATVRRPWTSVPASQANTWAPWIDPSQDEELARGQYGRPARYTKAAKPWQGEFYGIPSHGFSFFFQEKPVREPRAALTFQPRQQS